MHTKECLADALISAVQNMRDSSDIGPELFRQMVSGGELLDWAEDYLTEGTKTCICDE